MAARFSRQCTWFWGGGWWLMPSEPASVSLRASENSRERVIGPTLKRAMKPEGVAASWALAVKMEDSKLLDFWRGGARMRGEKDGANRTKAAQHRLIVAVWRCCVAGGEGLKRRGGGNVTSAFARMMRSLDENCSVVDSIRKVHNICTILWELQESFKKIFYNTIFVVFEIQRNFVVGSRSGRNKNKKSDSKKRTAWKAFLI
jgi:hypothetical protein